MEVKDGVLIPIVDHNRLKQWIFRYKSVYILEHISSWHFCDCCGLFSMIHTNIHLCSLPWKPTVKFGVKWGSAYWFVSAGANLHWVHDKSILLASASSRELDNCKVNYNHDDCVWIGGGLTTRVECMCWRTHVQSVGVDLWFILHFTGLVFCSKLDWTSLPSIYWDPINYHAYQVSGTHYVHDLVHLLLGQDFNETVHWRLSLYQTKSWKGRNCGCLNY